VGEGLLQPMHLLLILGIALLVFGPKKLPELGRGLGEAIRGFKTSLREGEQAETKPPTAPSTPIAPSEGDAAKTERPS
jgi:sec-independent protein translocase protein TatA